MIMRINQFDVPLAQSNCPPTFFKPPNTSEILITISCSLLILNCDAVARYGLCECCAQ